MLSPYLPGIYKCTSSQPNTTDIICLTASSHVPACTSAFIAQYTLEYYLEMADALVSHGVHILAIKDMVSCCASQIFCRACHMPPYC